MEIENHDFSAQNCANGSCFMDMDIDNLVDAFNHKTTVVWRPKLNFVNDINVIIEELKQYQTFIGLDIYEVLVSCGHNLTWDQEYYVSTEDLNVIDALIVYSPFFNITPFSMMTKSLVS